MFDMYYAQFIKSFKLKLALTSMQDLEDEEITVTLKFTFLLLMDYDHSGIQYNACKEKFIFSSIKVSCL